MRSAQPDLFGGGQPDLFSDAPPAAHKADPERVRARLERIVTEARGADQLPWDRATVRLYRTIVPQMILWLPDEEARRWRFAFETELERLEAV